MILNYDKILTMLREKKNFSYSRFGDGEFACMLGKKGSNRDGHRYFESLGHSLYKILNSKPSYYIGMRPLTKAQKIDIVEFDKLVKKNLWVSTEILPHASMDGKLGEFFETLKSRKVLLIANNNILRIDKFPHINVAVSYLDCWLNYELVKHRMKDKICDDIVILYCAGMMSCVLIDYFSSFNVTQIDCGSVFDPYVGVESRGYHKALRESWEEK